VLPYVFLLEEPEAFAACSHYAGEKGMAAVSIRTFSAPR
jgi:hypothetical protein